MRRREPRESSIESELREGVERLNGKCYKFVSPGCSGVSDRIIVLPYLPVWFVETKRPGKELESLQVLFRDEVVSRGQKHAMLDSTSKVAHWLAERAREIRLARYGREMVLR